MSADYYAFSLEHWVTLGGFGVQALVLVGKCANAKPMQTSKGKPMAPDRGSSATTYHLVHHCVRPHREDLQKRWIRPWGNWSSVYPLCWWGRSVRSTLGKSPPGEGFPLKRDTPLFINQSWTAGSSWESWKAGFLLGVKRQNNIGQSDAGLWLPVDTHLGFITSTGSSLLFSSARGLDR